MSMAIVRVSLPTNSYTTTITQIIGGYQVRFDYTGGYQYAYLVRCVSIPSIGSPVASGDHWTVEINFDSGDDPDRPLKPKTNPIIKKK